MVKLATYLWIMMSCLGSGHYSKVDVQQEQRILDLEPRKGWNLKGDVTVDADGRICLTADGRGFVWKSATLDVDTFPIMLARATNSLPRERWMIEVEKNDPPTFEEGQQIILLDKFAEEGGFIVPLKKTTGWSGNVTFTIIIGVEGHKGDRIVLDNLEAVKMTSAKPDAPQLSDPPDGAVVSRVAVHLCWYQVTNAVDYELQVSKRRDFLEHSSIMVTPPVLADRLPYLPTDEELPEPGRWFWRVRSVNIAGQLSEWSKTGTFTVRKTQGPRTPVLSIGSDHPLILLCSDYQHLVENWKSLPDDLRSSIGFRIEEISKEQTQRVLQKAQEHQIPIFFQASGPHDYYGQTSSRITLSEIERILVEFPVVKGIYICEQAFRVSPSNNRIMMDYAGRLIQLAAEHGKMVLWADGHWGRNLWIDVGLNKRLLETIRQHRRFFVPIWKMNGSLTAYSAHDAIFGLWISRSVDNWGVQPERWYWYEAGFGKLNEQKWFKEGRMEDFPPSFYGQMVLLGLSSGAGVYSFEPGSDIWDEHGSLSKISRQVTFPLLSEIIRHHLIPRREQVLQKVRSVYVANASDSHWALDYGTMYSLYESTYGIKHAFQMIPSSSRYFWLPILPRWTTPSVLNSFAVRLDADRSTGSEEVKRLLRNQYLASIEGDAWTVQLDDDLIVLNSSENWDVDQTFGFPMKGKLKRISGRINVNGYLVSQETEDALRVHLNGRAGKTPTLDLWLPQEPQRIVISPERALTKSHWDVTHHRLTLQFLLTGESVTAEIRF